MALKDVRLVRGPLVRTGLSIQSISGTGRRLATTVTVDSDDVGACIPADPDRDQVMRRFSGWMRAVLPRLRLFFGTGPVSSMLGITFTVGAPAGGGEKPVQTGTLEPQRVAHWRAEVVGAECQ